MASIHQQILLDVPADVAWDSLRDTGALHTRLVRGFVTECRLEDGGQARVVTFANGLVARELIVDVNDGHRRIAWSATGGRLSHHNASAQVLDDGEGRCRVVWVADLLPHAMAEPLGAMIAHGLAAMKQTLESNG